MNSYLEKYELDIIQLKQFEKYYELLIAENRKYNLTSIVEKKEVYIKHFCDSLEIINVMDFSKIVNICDIGSGAGFPGLPLKIKYPHLKLVIVESNRKKTMFLKMVVDMLKLDDVYILNERVEEIDIKYKDYFDLVVARAVSTLPILMELCIPYVKVEGNFVAMKGINYEDEIEKAQTGLKKLKSSIFAIKLYNLDEDMGNRALIIINKKNKTSSDYPRRYAIIKKSPLK
ncbi:MAG: 16S rRNA (guanine(527)-N(7))-methyltransferase RsmG [Bacilli bacterium]|nr:16S rRNA (guanine(527)-N(7))-methyltransferase RsmG [Bacilli bacterium]MDD2681612.1 16S rRNA (guanine(527)-N(7))-methyltransferase RsmG [Bacilli bacterium]MDD3120821.1 16S rRNA (guanine(527)-N(7))-methyltransferase RsmG [Bacilli bacterium]MDD4063016.1 16S rRNA (guanine(527)-N(7))-methyltransferase RsmG [Bacilli bacterium]MDD4481704.1 16S rRNA (guanine(527)-N(7))-methyltransferase RsmG [Bacilli bacterium]